MSSAQTESSGPLIIGVTGASGVVYAQRLVRYLLETCSRVSDAVAALTRLPHHMSYNLALLDRGGAHATVFVSPDRDLVVSSRRVSTNHQGSIEDRAHALFCDTEGRAARLDDLFAGAGHSAATLLSAFQTPPLFTRRYREGFGTVYTAHYEPDRGVVTLHWPTAKSLAHDLRAPAPRERVVCFSDADDLGSDGPGYDWIEELPSELRALILRWWRPEAYEHR